MNAELYSQLSYELTSELDTKEKKRFGIFFTPKNIILDCIDFILNLITPNTILEPSCGSGEFVKVLNEKLHLKDIDAIEYNESIYDRLQHVEWGAQNTITTFELDYLKYKTDKKYDLIIGNPPYFVMKKGDVDKKYNTY